jgi:TRAP-type C4-dicarboxylate transport system permease small subunit
LNNSTENHGPPHGGLLRGVNMENIKRLIDRCLYFSGAVFLVVILVMVSLEVFFRYVMNQSIPWSNEVSTIALVWMVFLSSSYAVSKHANLKIEVFVSWFPIRTQRIIDIIINILLLVFFIVFLTIGAQYSIKIFSAKSTALRISQSIFYIPVPIASIFMFFYTFVNLKERLHRDS